MNCFQNLLPLWYITTEYMRRTPADGLWIAFRIYYLCDTSQQKFYCSMTIQCCELLSEFITFVIHHNANIIILLNILVVNCFQNLLPLWYITTFYRSYITFYVLWIAFRIYYLCDTSQRLALQGFTTLCCELLSEFITFVIHHNKRSEFY